MKMIWIFLFFALAHVAYAGDLKIEINPPRPVVGEVFQVVFRIFTESNEEPEITFNPGGVEVVGKSNQGISTRTIYANGRLTVSREVTVAYDLVAAKSGNAFLRDIKINLGGKLLTYPVVMISVLKEAEEVPDIFVMADVPKKELYVGEGVIVRYYLYSKVPVSTVDIKKYPKLNNFLKRFLQEPDRSERVSVDGDVYLRTQIYAAKLFPEKPGELKVDSLSLSATYPSTRPGDPFGAFGLNRNFRTKNLSSETIKIQALPLPSPRPENFSGLVGKHDFQVQFGQTKLIVNEPLEIKLTVSGGGALENLEPPTLLKSSSFEEFETNGDLKISSADDATKTFDFTFLAKENASLPSSKVELTYFEPQIKTYVPVELTIPAIEIAGGNFNTPSSTKKEIPQENTPPEKKENPLQIVTKVQELAGPSLSKISNVRRWIPFLNLILALLTFVFAATFLIKRQGFMLVQSKHHIPASFKKGSFSLPEFLKWISPLIQKSGKSPVFILRDSSLDDQTKNYFIEILNSNDEKSFSHRQGEFKFTYHSGHFKKLGQYIESVKDETTP
jgi:hypothetical protein